MKIEFSFKFHGEIDGVDKQRTLMGMTEINDENWTEEVNELFNRIFSAMKYKDQIFSVPKSLTKYEIEALHRTNMKLREDAEKFTEEYENKIITSEDEIRRILQDE